MNIEWHYFTAAAATTAEEHYVVATRHQGGHRHMMTQRKVKAQPPLLELCLQTAGALSQDAMFMLSKHISLS